MALKQRRAASGDTYKFDNVHCHNLECTCSVRIQRTHKPH